MRNYRSGSIAALFIFSGMLISLSGCYKDNFDFDRMKEDMVTWEPDIAFPLVFSILTTEKIISTADSTNIYQYDSNNFITLIYRKRIFSQTINDFLQLPAFQAFNQNIALSSGEITQFTSSGSVQKTVNSGLTMSVNGPSGSQLDKVVLQDGNMHISFTSNFQHSGSLLVSMPELRLNGIPFQQSYPIQYQGGTVTSDIYIPLAGYEMDLNNPGGANTVPIDYTLTLNQGGGLTPTTSDQVQIQHSFEQLRIAYADGYFGNFNLLIDPADVDIDVLENEHDGQLYFEDPRFRLNVKNSIGAEILVNINQLYAAGDPGQLDLNLSTVIPGGQFTILAAPSVGDSSTQQYYFTKDNSNIKTIINDQYEKIHHDISASVNPNGPTTNFASLNSSVEVTADIELPFWGFSDHFTIRDTLEVSLDQVSHLSDNVEKALLRINTVSHFPVDGLLKLYFADSTYALLDSVLTDGSYIIRSGVVNSDGKTISAVQTNNDVPLDTVRINHLFSSKYLILATDLTSTDDAGRNIKLYGEDNIEVHIGLRVKLKASPSVIDEF